MAGVIDRYEREVLPQRSATTQVNTKYILERLRKVFGAMDPKDITTQHVIQFRDIRGRSGKTAANRDLEVLSTLFRHAIEWGQATTNPVRDVRHFEEKPRDLYVTDEAFRAVYLVCPDEIQIAMDLALLTGQRRADLLTLRWDQVTDDGLVFRQSKTGKKLIVEWSDDLRAVIERARGKSPDYVLGKALTPAGFQSAWRRAIEKAQKADQTFQPFAFHDLRAKSASDDAELSRASARLGHADARITRRVYRRLPERVSPLRVASHKS
ncbi:MAG: tyrosine-type recombinase/integrase [Candidatus Limnocylindrus sp.]